MKTLVMILAIYHEDWVSLLVNLNLVSQFNLKNGL